jgi:serine/threonine protein kinase
LTCNSMAPKLIREGKIQVLGQTANSVVYAVASDSNTGYAKDSQTVLKGGTIWYEGREALGPGKDAEESDERARKEASIYEILGRHERILEFYGLETGILGESVPKAWAVRLERAPHGSLRNQIVSRSPADADPQTRLQLAVQLAEDVAYLHSRGVIWGDPSTRNVLVVDLDVDVGR